MTVSISTINQEKLKKQKKYERETYSDVLDNLMGTTKKYTPVKIRKKLTEEGSTGEELINTTSETIQVKKMTTINVTAEIYGRLIRRKKHVRQSFDEVISGILNQGTNLEENKLN